MKALVSACLTAAFAAVLVLQPAGASLVSTLAEVPPQSPAIDFSQFFVAGRTLLSPGIAPIEIDQLPETETVVVRPIAGTQPGLILGAEIAGMPSNWYYLGGNGQWTNARGGFLGVGGGNGSTSTVRIEFLSGPVAIVGGLFNYAPGWPPVKLSALRSDLSVIEQYVIDQETPIVTTDLQNVGAFRGISRPQNDIYALEISAPFAVLDDIRFFRVPEPTSSLLAVISLTAFKRRPRRR